ncbi:MAG: Pirin family protein [Acidimicrobiales bacterium]|nr:Pirin family protein [Acidimicrobiales bacterium]
MSGPVRTEDVSPREEVPAAAGPPTIEVTPSRDADVGGHQVRRALPRRERRTVGAWCFADHMGPTSFAADDPVAIGPHPHMGLQTVTWLVDGALRHRDSLGSDQVIRPGELNLMTAGLGISHAEEPVAAGPGSLHGIQLWVAQPETTRNGAAAFEHHQDLPQVDVGSGVGTVLVGSLADATSPARRDTDHVGVDLQLRSGRALLPVSPAHELALVVLLGAVEVDGVQVTPGHLAYLGAGRDELAVDAASEARLLLLGGVPFESPILMWWNYVARTRDEVDAARADWMQRSERFGETSSSMERIPAPRPPWAADA